LQRVIGNQTLVELLILAVVKQDAEARSRINPEVMFALGAYLQILVESLLPNHLAAMLTLQPEPFGANMTLAAFRGFISSRPVAGKPSH
jgi:hypothetical protein